MKKHLLAIVTISVFCFASLAACSKKGNTDGGEVSSTGSVTGDASGQLPEGGSPAPGTGDPIPETITLGGLFYREGASLSFFIADASWEVSGYYSGAAAEAPVILSGKVSMGNGPVFLYSDSENELSFTFAADSVTVAVNKGTAYTGFAGSYPRVPEAGPQQQITSPEHGSSLELLGRIALTHYILQANGIAECTIDVAKVSFDNAYMEKFLLAYADLFLSSEAAVYPEISEDSVVTTLPKEDLNELFLTTTGGSFDVSKFDGTAGGIVCRDDLYYIPCHGAYSGGLTTPDANPDLISNALSLGGVVSKADGTRYDLTMTLSTSEDAAYGHAGIRLNSVSYKLEQ